MGGTGTALVGAVLAAAIAAAVALIVSWRQTNSSQTAWVLEKRHEAYRGVLAAAAELLGDVWAGDQDDAIADSDRVAAFTRSFAAVFLVAPTHIRARCDLVQGVAWNAHANPGNTTEFMDELNKLNDELWEDLVPPHMRGPSASPWASMTAWARRNAESG